MNLDLRTLQLFVAVVEEQTSVRQAEGILENDPPLIPIAYEKIYDAWYIKGQTSARVAGTRGRMAR